MTDVGASDFLATDRNGVGCGAQILAELTGLHECTCTQYYPTPMPFVAPPRGVSTVFRGVCMTYG